jgi:hypothetical protein
MLQVFDMVVIVIIIYNEVYYNKAKQTTATQSDAILKVPDFLA